MNLKEIKNVLTETFNKELDYGKKRHIIFWYDEEGEWRSRQYQPTHL